MVPGQHLVFQAREERLRGGVIEEHYPANRWAVLVVNRLHTTAVAAIRFAVAGNFAIHRLVDLLNAVGDVFDRFARSERVSDLYAVVLAQITTG
jgi:hypothetical protein